MFGLFSPIDKWGITQLKNALLLNGGFSALSDGKKREELLEGAIRALLKGVFADNYGKFNEIEKEMLKRMFDSPKCSLNDIEEYLRLKFGKGYDKKAKRGLDEFCKHLRKFENEFGDILK